MVKLITKQQIAYLKSGGRPINMYKSPASPITSSEGWQGNEYHYIGRDKNKYVARINSLGQWEYRQANGPSFWKAMPKGYTTTGGFKFDNNSRWDHQVSPSNEFTTRVVNNVKEMNKNSDQMLKARERANKGIVPKKSSNLADLQNALWYAGAFNGLKDRHGREIVYNTAVDGIKGNITNQAIQNAINMGYDVDETTGTLTKIKTEPTQPKISFKTTSGAGYIPSNQFEYIPTQETPEQEIPRSGHAIYLHYPNFKGASRNAIKIGDFDPGEAIGNPSIPVGHAATILIDENGNANYYEYGRYKPENGHLIGTAQRPTVKGGNWRHFKLEPQKAGESDSAYVARIQGSLPDTKTGAYQAMTIPDVDTAAAIEWINSQANDPNREEYGIDNTCATGACKVSLDFRKKKHFDPFKIFNYDGYDIGSKLWSLIPGSTDSYAQRARASSTGVYTMNK